MKEYFYIEFLNRFTVFLSKIRFGYKIFSVIILIFDHPYFLIIEFQFFRCTSIFKAFTINSQSIKNFLLTTRDKKCQWKLRKVDKSTRKSIQLGLSTLHKSNYSIIKRNQESTNCKIASLFGWVRHEKNNQFFFRKVLKYF